jgi:hypothetical protein
MVATLPTCDRGDCSAAVSVEIGHILKGIRGVSLSRLSQARPLNLAGYTTYNHYD